MKIRFLASTRRDFDWFRRYYESVFREGLEKAQSRYRKTLAVLRDNPRIGHPTDDGSFSLSIPRTPFRFIYRIDDDTIDILHVLDSRSGNGSQPTPDEGLTE